MLSLLLATALASGLTDPGRSEVRVYSAPYTLAEGRSVEEMQLLERLERLDYTRVKQRPASPGEYFYGRDTFWVYRRAFRHDGVEWPAALIGIDFASGDAVGTRNGNDKTGRLGGAGDVLEPELIAESLTETRARRIPISLDELPDHVWQPLLALEDHRFFDHVGVDGISIARALFENVRGGQVSQGGSTLTQQLVKNRDLTPKRTLDRKASEALRALALEAEYSKEEILEAYLNTVYYGHIDGVGVYGLGAAAEAYFSTSAADLSLDQAAALAAVLQGPNGLSPVRHPDACKKRRDHALTRMQELGWATETEIGIAQKRGLGVKKQAPSPEASPSVLAALRPTLDAVAKDRLDRGLGIRVETTLDPLAQQAAERALSRRLRDFDGVQGAVVMVDATSGAVRAYVGGDPRSPDHFDRAGIARRQPGSTAKPFVALEAVERCGVHGPLHLRTHFSDSAFALDLPTGVWSPDNYDHKDHGPTTLRDALVHSYNRPFARIGQVCGTDAIAERMAWAGLPIPESAPASVVLGTVEVTPIELASAYTVFLDGRAHEPVLVSRVEKPRGALLHKNNGGSTRAASATGARLVHSVMEDVVDRGTATRADAVGVDVIGKTGSTAADAWYAGHADGVVTVVWLGKDDATRLGISGGRGAAPVAASLAPLALAYPAPELPMPVLLVQKDVDPDTGLRVGLLGSGEPEWFRMGVTPPVKPLLSKGRPAVIE
ncbi:MAG: transglycosylase domain-containing protein [Proteobacteria bacterium]|nr:transglycosylase domain-containing protein [Pseudomonadota bacterium]